MIIEDTASTGDRAASGDSNCGIVVSVRGSVVDARFPQRLPSLYHVLRAGEDDQIVIEVVQSYRLKDRQRYRLDLHPRPGVGFI